MIDLDDVIDREGPEVPETVSGSDWRVLFVEEFRWCVEHMESSVAGRETVGADGVNVGEDYFVGVSSEGGVEDVYDHDNQVGLVVQDSGLVGVGVELQGALGPLMASPDAHGIDVVGVASVDGNAPSVPLVPCLSDGGDELGAGVGVQSLVGRYVDHGNQVGLVVQAGLSGGVGGIESLLKGAISLTLELAGRLGDGLASGPTALDLVLRA